MNLSPPNNKTAASTTLVESPLGSSVPTAEKLLQTQQSSFRRQMSAVLNEVLRHWKKIAGIAVAASALTVLQWSDDAHVKPDPTGGKAGVGKVFITPDMLKLPEQAPDSKAVNIDTIMRLGEEHKTTPKASRTVYGDIRWFGNEDYPAGGKNLPAPPLTPGMKEQ